ncbi:universal stress protein UspA [Halobacteriales archaeon QS_4_62_28]|nr:MAG: universal stress protein UspA [Halobacteriales archaeon QS_4_62_28]
MYNVLMPIDSDEDRTMAQVEAIRNLPAAADYVEATLLHVFDDQEAAETTTPTQLTAGRQVQQHLTNDGINVETMSTSGDPSTAILQAAEEVDADQIVLGGRKRSPLGSLIFGSVSQGVMLDANRPVTITGSLQREGNPSHRCADCGEEYYSDHDTEISTCRNCGGTNVEGTW